MPRTIELSVQPTQAANILARVEALECVVGASWQKGVSVKPPGDVVVLRVTNEAARAVLDLVREFGVLESGSVVSSRG